uniref:Methyltransferase domain-containing protein n=1 Tax=Heterosigma akashiwo TaxID=2829 RepID=A0A7S3YDG3_HETAK
MNKRNFILGATTVALLAIDVCAFFKNPSTTNITSMLKNNEQKRTKTMPPAAIAASSSGSQPPAVNMSAKEQKTAKIWNRFADGYAKQPIKDEESYQKKLEMTREYMAPHSKVLEFGCGTGGTALLHAPYVSSVHAIDISSRMIEIAKQRQKETGIENVDFQCTGIDSMDVPDESYDIVLGLSVLHLLPNKDGVMKKIYNKLKPGGYFMSSTICMGDMSRMIRWVTSPLSFLGVLPELNIFTKAELTQSMEQAGFTIEGEFQSGKDKAAVFLVARKL